MHKTKAPAQPHKKLPLPNLSVSIKGGTIRLDGPKGDRQWIAKADSIHGDFPSGNGKMINLKCTMLENGKQIVSGTAGEAIYYPQNHQVMLADNVEAKWPEREASLTAKKMVWSLANKTIVAQGNVIMRYKDQKLTGGELRVDSALKSMIMTDGDKR